MPHLLLVIILHIRTNDLVIPSVLRDSVSCSGSVFTLLLHQVLRALSGGVESVSLKSGTDIKGVSALVVYESHHAAAMAKKVIREGV